MNPHERNTAIEALIRRKDAKGEHYTPTERDFIAAYSGGGGLAEHGATGTGILYEFYTPAWLCTLLWQLAHHYGYTGGPVLEPACGSGNLLIDAPKKAPVVAFETNPTSARIAEIRRPGAIVHRQSFETAFLQPPRYTARIPRDGTWLPEAPFELCIANPPYGAFSGTYAPLFKARKHASFEAFFIRQALHLLRPGGLLIFIIPSAFLRNGNAYQNDKARITQQAALRDAYRLPPVFKHTAVGTDLIVLQKHHP